MRTPNPHPLKLADLTIRRNRSDAEARSILRSLHQDHGAVFCVLGIESPNEELREKIFLMCAQHVEHVAQTIRNDHNPARAFEQMLAHINEDFARLAPELGIKKEKCHAIFAVCAKNQLFLSGFGNLLALFLHKTADRRFSIYELHTQLNDENTTWEKPCSVVLDGELHEGDVFYVATHIPANLLSTAALQDILVTLPAKGALERLEGFIPPAMPFAGVAIQVSNKEKATHLRVNPLGSLDMLQKTQDRTAEVLGERMPQKKDSKTAWLGRTDARAVVSRVGNVFVNIFGKIVAFTQKSGKKLFEEVKKHYRKPLHSSQKNTLFIKSISKATASPLITVLTIGTLILVFGGGIFLWNTTQTKRNQEDTFTRTSAEIKEKIAQIEGSLIYNNTQGATQSLQSASALLAELIPANKEQEDVRKQIQGQLQTLEEKAQGITRFSPTLLASLPEGKEGVTGTIDTNTYLFTENKEIYRFNGLQSTWELQTVTLGTIGSPILTGNESETTTLLIDNNKQLARYNLATQTLNPIVSGANAQKSITDIYRYNDTLYLLNATDQQIIRMRPQGDGYEAGTPWITARSSDIQDARALAIDGNIYVLTKDTVRIFFAGKEQSWKLAPLTTPLKNPTDIFTTTESRELNILDPENKRVIVVNKESGAIIAQYISDDIENALALSVDEAGNTMKILTKTGIMQFTPNHLLQ